jgi:hypothetical protein
MKQLTHNFSHDLLKLERDSYDNCSMCGRKFALKELIHSGYDKEEHSLYVGDCCSSNLSETASRYKYLERSFSQPPDSAILWRYFSITKLVSMLKTRSLFFTRIDKFEDPFECAKGLQKRKPIWDEHYLDFFQKAMINLPLGLPQLTKEQVETEAKRLIEGMPDLGEYERLTPC